MKWNVFPAPDCRLKSWLRLLPVLVAPLSASVAWAFDPLVPAETNGVNVFDLTVHDDARQRDIPMSVYLPSQPAPAAVVLFSHGLGGSREGRAYLGWHWAARGYGVVYLQHPGTDTSVWQSRAPRDRLAAMQQAAKAWLDGDGPRTVLEPKDQWQRK
jgi:predicted dienelactone hydrolase